METFLKVMPFVLQLMGLAERFLSKPNSGVEKKVLVLQGVKTAVDAMENVSTGGQKKTWQNIQGYVSEFVDATAAVVYKK